jgi:hypothetical protein
MPLPPHLWHRTTLSPFLSVPFPSQFLHFCFFWAVFFCMVPSYAAQWVGGGVQSVPLAYAHGSQGRDRSGWLGRGDRPRSSGVRSGTDAFPRHSCVARTPAHGRAAAAGWSRRRRRVEANHALRRISGFLVVPIVLPHTPLLCPQFVAHPVDAAEHSRPAPDVASRPSGLRIRVECLDSFCAPRGAGPALQRSWRPPIYLGNRTVAAFQRMRLGTART